MSLILPDNSVPVQALLKRFALTYLPIVIILSIFLLSYARFDDQMRVEKIEVRENNRIKIAKNLLTQDFSAISTDLNIIAKLPYLDSNNHAEQEEMSKFFMELVQQSRFYNEMRYIDTSGQENIRVNYNDGKSEIVPREQLQNKSRRYYFRDTIKLNQGEIFVSPLDLNVEHDRLEIPLKPTIRFGTPLFDNAGRKKGVILFNYFGDKLLQKFLDAMQGDDPHSGMLLNRDGYWLSSAKREDEWGFMLGKSERTFGHDFAEEWRAISAAEHGTLLTANGLFAYTTVYPLLPGQISSTGSNLANAPSQEDLLAHEYYWKIVSFVPHDVISGAAFYNQTSGRILLAFIYLLFAMGAWIIANATLSRRQAEEKILKLNEELESRVQERTQQLLDAQEELVRNEKLAVLGQVAGSVGHELRNPLGVMSNAVYFLQTVLFDADKAIKEYLNIIKDEIKGSERIVSDLLDSVRTKPPHPEIVGVRELLEKTLHKCAVPSTVTVKLDIPATLSPLRVDPQQIHQVFRNLISNGIEAMQEGGVLEIQASEDASTQTIIISVRDSGTGIAPEVLVKLFQPLFTTKARGVGLGMVVVKNLTEANGGSVRVESEEGKGSVFTVTLPSGS